jgi:DNA-binding HxlR family transcriptional regulator
MLTIGICSQAWRCAVSHGSQAVDPAAKDGAESEAESAVSFNAHCPIERAMGLVGSRSAMLIMREAFYGTSRFDDFVNRVEMAPATASTHLRTLTQAGLLQRRPYREPGGRTRDEYALTEAGADLMPVIFGLFEWGRRHTDVQPLVEFAHAGCGSPIEVHVRCAAGHEVGPDEIEWRRTAPHRPAPEPPASAPAAAAPAASEQAAPEQAAP